MKSSQPEVPAPLERAVQCLEKGANAQGPKVYLASPYALGDKERNAKASLEMALLLLKLGYEVHAPLLNHWMPEQSCEIWMELDGRALATSDLLFRVRGQSKGADAEVIVATKLGIPIFYSLYSLLRDFPPQGRMRPIVLSNGHAVEGSAGWDQKRVLQWVEDAFPDIL